MIRNKLALEEIENQLRVLKQTDLFNEQESEVIIHNLNDMKFDIKNYQINVSVLKYPHLSPGQRERIESYLSGIAFNIYRLNFGLYKIFVTPKKQPEYQSFRQRTFIEAFCSKCNKRFWSSDTYEDVFENKEQAIEMATGYDWEFKDNKLICEDCI